jgi:hypothetical protein
MALDRLHTEKGDFATEFSSWSQSLTFVLGLYANTVEYSSVIDTQELHEDNPAYYVPLLPIHTPGTFPYDHEYLVHDVIQGRSHRAVPVGAFRNPGVTSDSFTWYLGTYNEVFLTQDLVRRCRSLGEQYGEKFALAVTLALLAGSTASGKASGDIIRSYLDLSTLRHGIDGLALPGRRASDASIMRNVVHVDGWPEIRRFIGLMRNCIRMKGYEMLEEKEEDMQNSESRQVATYEEETEDDMANRPIESVLRPSASKRPGRKPPAKRTRPVTRSVTRQEEQREERRFLRMLKNLRIDMNRHGRKANNGENEKSVDVEMGNT